MKPLSSEQLLERIRKSGGGSRPAVLHGWGEYKITLLGLDPRFQYRVGMGELAQAEEVLYRTAGSGWFHVGIGPDRELALLPRRARDGKAEIWYGPEGWIELDEARNLKRNTPQTPPARRCRLESKSEIDDWYARRKVRFEDILASGAYDHVRELRARYGEEAVIAVNTGSPAAGLPDSTFEEALIAAHEKPDLVRHCQFRACEEFVSHLEAMARAGADAFISSEGYCGEWSLLAPERIERIFTDPIRFLYDETRRLGLTPIGYFLGDIRPLTEFINRTAPTGVLIEESKKNFVLDPVEIRKRIHQDILLFGNVDSFLLRMGDRETIRAAAREQMKASDWGPFVGANGSPIIQDTPIGNLHEFLDASRNE